MKTEYDRITQRFTIKYNGTLTPEWKNGDDYQEEQPIPFGCEGCHLVDSCTHDKIECFFSEDIV